MESFQLSLNQVNFEHYHLGEEASSTEPLHSFSNLVCYDLDLKSDESGGNPVRAKRVNLIEGENFNSSDSYNFLEICEQRGLEYCEEELSTSERKWTAMATSAHAVQPILEENLLQSSFQVAVNSSASQRLESEIPTEIQDLHAGDTFRAFTETVEALALQKSVIGGSSILPASMEEIEKAIAEAQAKMKLKLPEKADSSRKSLSEPSTISNVSDLRCESSLPFGIVHSQSISLQNSSKETRSSHQSSTPSTPKVEPDAKSTVSVQSDTLTVLPNDRNTFHAEGSIASIPNISLTSPEVPENGESPQQRQLIRVSAERVVTAAQPRGSWFWGSSKTPEASANIKNSATGVSKKNPKKSKKSNGSKLENDEQNNTISALGSNMEVSQSSEVGENNAYDSVDENFVRKSHENGVSNTERESHGDSSARQLASPVKTIRSTQDHEVLDNIGEDVLEAEKSTPSELVGSTNSQLGKHPDLQYLRHEVGASPDGRKSKRTSISSVSLQSSVAEGMHEDSLLEKVLREKAGLEGRLEMLEQENREMLREHVDLKAKVAATEEQIKASSATGQGLTLDRKALVADVETLRQNRARLEAVIMDAHKLLEEKDQEVKTLERDVELARQAGEKHLERVADGKRQLANRDSTIKDLKTKIAELFVETQTSDQSRQIMEGELVAIKADIAALTEAKEWYASQLKAAQKDRNRLQSEAASAKAETIAASVAAERLRAENARMKRNLTEVEQRVLMEKQKLAHHLEDIEHDIMEREAAFAAQLGQAVEMADRQLSSSPNATDVYGKDEVDLLRAELGRIKELAEVTRHESIDLSRRLALSQQCVVERDETIKLLERDRETAEVRAESAEHDAALHLETVRQFENERAELQAQLVASSKEKKVIDESLQTLKRNTVVLETSFRKMQLDLVAKSAEVDRLTSYRQTEVYPGLSEIPLVFDTDRQQLAKSEQQKTEGSVKSVGSSAEVTPASSIQIEKVSVEIQTDFLEIPAPVAASVEATSNVLSTDTADVSIYRQAESVSLVEYNVLETPVAAFESSEHEFARAEVLRLQLERAKQQHQIDDLQGLLACSQDGLAEAEQQVNSLNEELKIAATRRLEAESGRDIIAERVRDLEVQLQNVIDERSQLERLRDQSDRNALAVHSSAISHVLEESGEVRSKIDEIQRDSQKEVSKLKAKILKLNKQLEASIAEQSKVVMDYEVQVRELNQQLTLARESVSKLGCQIEETRQQSSMDSDERVARLQADLHKATLERDSSIATQHELEVSMQQANLDYSQSIEEQRQRYIELEAELQSLKIALEDKEAVDEHAANLALELEKERGRLAGLSQSHAALKEHAQLLEATLADRVSTDVRIESASRDEIEKRDQALAETRSQIQHLENELVKERQNVKEIRAQLLTEKGNHVKTRRLLEHLTAEHGHLTSECNEMRENYAKLTTSSDSLDSQELERKLTAERIAAETKVIVVERDRLLRELEDQKNRDAALQDNIQGLEWRISEKDNEIAATHQRLKLIEDRQATELASLSHTLQSTISELSSVREELASVKKEKSSLQMKMIPLQAALKKALLLKVDLSVATETTAELERLLQDTTPTAVDSKPLSFLQATLSGLRGEISSLQMQITEHTSAVQSSSVAWRELEAQVQDLREVCQTSAADRAAAASSRPAAVPPSMKLPPSLTPRTTIMTPASGPVVLAGNLANIMASGVSPPPRYDSSSTSSSSSSLDNPASNSRRSSKSSIGSDVSGVDAIRQ